MKTQYIFALVGPTGCGKTTLVNLMLEEFKGRLNPLKSTTSRQRGVHGRDLKEEDRTYHFVSKEEFERKILAGELVQWVEYADNYYGHDQLVIMEAFSSDKHLITSLNEQGVLNLRRAGFSVIAVRIEGVGSLARPGRALEDRRRRHLHIGEHAIIRNDFTDDNGLKLAAKELARIIRGQIGRR